MTMNKATIEGVLLSLGYELMPVNDPTDVRTWPLDEATAYRNAGGFLEGRMAVQQVRTQKLADAIEKFTEGTNGDRTIPFWAYKYVTNAVFRDGHLYPDTVVTHEGKDFYPDSNNAEAINALKYFTMENYSEWSGAAIICPRAPEFERTLVRFDNISKFIAQGYNNPAREPGEPDWYFFWTKYHTAGSLKKWARSVGLIPEKDLPQGRGGFGIDTGLRSL